MPPNRKLPKEACIPARTMGPLHWALQLTRAQAELLDAGGLAVQRQITCCWL